MDKCRNSVCENIIEIYKKNYDDSIGQRLRQAYDNARIRNEIEFREELQNVLLDCEKI